MDYEFFQAMTAEEAQTFLNRFLEIGRQGMQEARNQAEQEGVHCDYSIITLAAVLKWMMKRVQIHRVPVQQDIPWWIRQTHKEGLTEFDDESTTLLLRAAYYMGECFARLPSLRWATGDPEYMEKNMPVVAGFPSGQELPPLVVVDNLFARIAGSDGPPERIDSTIEVWMKDYRSNA